MKIHSIATSYSELTYDELTPDDALLLREAEEATKGSGADYSRFRVGAAILVEGGRIIKGSNQENASYPCGICAERTALFYTQSEMPEARILSLAIKSPDSEGPISPCGLCRQALAEAECRQGFPIRLLLGGKNAVYMFESVAAILPLSFKMNDK